VEVGLEEVALGVSDMSCDCEGKRSTNVVVDARWCRAPMASPTSFASCSRGTQAAQQNLGEGTPSQRRNSSRRAADGLEKKQMPKMLAHLLHDREIVEMFLGDEGVQDNGGVKDTPEPIVLQNRRSSW